MFLVVKQIIDESGYEKTHEHFGQTITNLVNLNYVKRIALRPGKNEAEIYFQTPNEYDKKGMLLEDWLKIEVPDKKEFIAKIKEKGLAVFIVKDPTI